MSNRLYLGVFFILLSAFGFGVMPILAVVAYAGGVGVSTLLLLRFTLAALLFFTFIYFTTGKLRVTRQQALYLFLLGGLLYTAMSMLFFFAVKNIPTSLASLMLNSYPVFVAILSFLIDKERITGRMMLAILLAFVGMGLVLGTTFGNINILGVLAALGAGLIYSAYIIIGNRVVKQIPPMLTTAYVTLFTAISLLVTNLVTGSLDLQVSTQSWLGIIGITLFSTVLAILMQFKGMDLIGTTRASVLSLFEPLITIGLSALLFHEQLTGLQMVGGIIIVAGGILVVASRSAEQKTPDATTASLS